MLNRTSAASNKGHHTKEAFQVVDLSSCLHILWVITVTAEADVLPDQCHAIELDCRHHLLVLTVQEQLDSDAMLLLNLSTPHATARLLICVDHQ